MQDVYDASAQVATGRGDSRFVIPPSRLSDIERGHTVPNIFRLYALAYVYRVSMQKVLKFYGAG